MRIILKELKKIISEVRSVSEALQRLSTFPPVSGGSGDRVRSPLPICDDLDTIMSSLGLTHRQVGSTISRQKTQLLRMTVEIASLMTMQNYVVPSVIEAALNGHPPEGDPIAIKLPDGRLVVTDGNHRVVTAMLLRESSIMVGVFDLQAFAQETSLTASSPVPRGRGR